MKEMERKGGAEALGPLASGRGGKAGSVHVQVGVRVKVFVAAVTGPS